MQIDAWEGLLFRCAVAFGCDLLSFSPRPGSHLSTDHTTPDFHSSLHNKYRKAGHDPCPLSRLPRSKASLPRPYRRCTWKQQISRMAVSRVSGDEDAGVGGAEHVDPALP